MCSHPNLSGKLENDGEIQIKCSSFTFPPIICDSDLEPAGWSWKEITQKIQEIVQILTNILFERVAKNHQQKMQSNFCEKNAASNTNLVIISRWFETHVFFLLRYGEDCRLQMVAPSGW